MSLINTKIRVIFIKIEFEIIGHFLRYFYSKNEVHKFFTEVFKFLFAFISFYHLFAYNNSNNNNKFLCLEFKCQK